MPFVFEDEDELYSEGMDEFVEHMEIIDSTVLRSLGSETTRTGTESSMCRVALSECTRTLTAQKATTSNRSPSPMDIITDWQEMQVDADPGTSTIGHGTATTLQNMPPMSAVQPMSAITVPTKRSTNLNGLPSPTSRSPSPSARPQPAKRLHEAAPRRFGEDLDPFYIAHDPLVQPLLDANNLAWGTIYEVARGVTKGHWAWSSVTKEKVLRLSGTNACAAHQVAAVMKGHEVPPKTPVVAELWAEYDREQDAIIENKGRGLGGMGLWKGKDDWYGGRIQQVGRLVARQGDYAIHLEKPEIRRSHRFSRFLGSRRLLQLRIPNELLYKPHGDKVRSLLSGNKFIICGRVFLPFHAKEGSVYMMETDEDFERVGSNQDGDQFRISLGAFIKWHNPLELNKQQPISKWSTRWALGLSTSVPTIEFDPQHIYYEEDEYVDPKDWEGKAPAEKVLTDGCGFINGAALTQIMRCMKYGIRPTAVQGRIGGSKGMWLLHPNDQNPYGPAKIWIRPSQTKIQLGKASKLDKAQRIFDLLAPSRVTGPSRLSSQTLTNLAYNGIQHQLLKDLMAQGLKEEIQSLIDWTHPQSMLVVWKAVERAGNVVVSRLRRLLTGQTRALGLGQLRPMDDQSQENEDEDDGNPDYIQPFNNVSHKKYSGQPTSLHESVLELLQAGFHPLKLEYLFKKLEHVIALVLNDYVEKFHIPVVESCEAYIVPDPYGVLEEGQIHFKSSEPIIIPSTGEQTNIILGEVLVSRNPTRLPSDIQKVIAVSHPNLSNYYNVIVFPVKGTQSLASYLGGGDYDGDTVMLNWCKPLVEQFKGHSLCAAPTNLSTFFEREVEHVRDFDKRISKLSDKQAQQNLQKILLLGLADDKKGLYSKYHDAAAYHHGYGGPQAIRLAYMFTTCLDSSKTGLRVKSTVFEKDRDQWGSRLPYYVLKLEQGKKSNNKSHPSITSDTITKHQDSGPFILDVLVDEGDKLRVEALNDYRKLKVQSSTEDQDLSKPWYAAKAKATEAKKKGIPGFAENMEAIEAHVNKAWEEYQTAISINQNSKSSDSQTDVYSTVAASYARSPFKGFVLYSDDDVLTLKASLASIKSLSFAFSVAFHDLCAIKARATGHVAITNQFSQCVSIPSVIVRTLSQVYGTET